MTSDEQYTFYEKLTDFLVTNKNIFYFIGIMAFLLLFVNIEDDYILNINDLMNVVILVFSGVVLFFYIMLKTKKCALVFNEEDLAAETRIAGISVNKRTYAYDTIRKFLIGRKCETGKVRRYTIYFDNNEKIVKLITVNSYKECMRIMNEIKSKSQKLICDMTDESYITEEDLFREYYKMKNLIDEVKNET